jgi:hypothetical protein
MEKTLSDSIELNAIATLIADLAHDANATQTASALRGWDGPAAVSVTRFAVRSFLQTLQDICIDAHAQDLHELRDLAWKFHEEYRTRPGAVTTAEVLNATAEMRNALQA